MTASFSQKGLSRNFKNRKIPSKVKKMMLESNYSGVRACLGAQGPNLISN